jgi:serine protease
VGVAAPAGNCVNSSGACLKSIDTTSNTGLTVPSASTYTNETNANLGTSFSAPIVSGIAALMRSVNANLTPAQLIARIEASAVTFPQPAGLPVCPMLATDGSDECACPSTGGQCGSGMVNALNAVMAAERPIAAVVVPAMTETGASAILDASGSAASCGRTVASYAWTTSGGVTLSSSAAAAQVTVVPTGAAGTVTLTVTDSLGAVDTVVLSVSAAGVITAPATTPSSAGTSEGACPAAVTFAAAAPTVSAAFSPANVNPNVVSTLTITLANSNGFDLTQTTLTETRPTGLVQATASSATPGVAPATTCAGSGAALVVSGGSVALSGAIIPAAGSCTVTVPVQSAAVGSFTDTVALTTAPAGANAAAATATLSVTAPSKSGGGALDWWDALFAIGVLLAGRRHVKRGGRRSV